MRRWAANPNASCAGPRTRSSARQARTSPLSVAKRTRVPNSPNDEGYLASDLNLPLAKQAGRHDVLTLRRQWWAADQALPAMPLRCKASDRCRACARRRCRRDLALGCFRHQAGRWLTPAACGARFGPKRSTRSLGGLRAERRSACALRGC